MNEATGKPIRVIYRWRLGPEHRGAFKDWWHEGTLRIRASYDGALGSTLMFPIDDESQIVAIARWRCRADLERFWASPGGTPFDHAVMESAEIFDEVDDLTIQP